MRLDNPAALFISSRPPEINVISPRLIEKKKEMIAHCCVQHTKCGPLQAPRLPTRVINVHERESATVHLHITDPDGEFAHYLTLSYCWGGEQPIQTLRRNIQNLSNNISLVELPQTLQDAVQTTRLLGYRYLWVDALCIVQDDADDKSREIARMAEIYHNSTVTIVAPNSKTVNEGYLMNQRKQPPFFRMPVSLPDGEVGEVGIGHPCPLAHFSWELMPLSKRAWTFQESLLAKRILYYGPYEVLYCCQTLGFIRLLPSYIQYCDNEIASLSDICCSKDKLECWSDIVRQYTLRHVTFPNDRPYAIAGIASALEETWAQKYVFGSWTDHFLEMLTWFNVAGFPSHPSLQRSDRAPSWSWLSIDGHIGIHCRSKLRSDCVIKSDLSAVAKGAVLSMECPVIPKDNWPVLESNLYTVHWDLESGNDSADCRTCYLYLGRESKVFSEWHYAYVMIIVEERTDVFRRVGLMRIHTRSAGVMTDIEQRLASSQHIYLV